MTSKARVLSAFDHWEPDRVPLWYGAAEQVTQALMRRCQVADEEELMRCLHIDFRRVQEVYTGPPLHTFADGTRENIWGVIRGGSYYGQPLTHPLAGVETVEQVLAHPWPTPDWFDFSHVRQQCQRWAEYAIIGGPWAVVFTDTSELVGMEEYFIKMHTHPEVIEAVTQKVSDFYCELALRFFEAAAGLLDIFFFGDDFGTQRDLFLNPEMWRRFSKPHIRRLNELGKKAGLKTMFHSCGAVRKIIPDLIEIGLDAVNPVQVRAQGMDLAALKRDFGDKITFHGGLDHQEILPFGSEEEVRAEVRRVIDIMAPGGGFCLAPSHDLLLGEFPPENILAMYDEAYHYSVYHK